MDANKNPAQTLTAFKQAYQSLGARNEHERGRLASLSRGLVYDPSALRITSSAATLEKYIGNPVIDKNFKNNENRNALTSAFVTNLGSIASGFVEQANKSGDLYSQMKSYEMTKKLMSMPPEAYNSRSVYRLLDEFSDLQNMIASGVPLGHAISRSKTSKRIEGIYNEAIDEYKASQLNLMDESISAFLKGAVSGAVLTPAASIDRIMNTGRWVLGLEDMQNGLVSVVKNLVPDLTQEEQNSILGRAGQTAGSIASIIGMYGVPTTPKQVAMLAMIPKGIEVAQSAFGLSDEFVDHALGAFEGGILFKTGMNMYGQGLKDAAHPKNNGMIGKTNRKVTAENIVRSVISNMVEQASYDSADVQRIFADAVIDIESGAFGADSINSAPKPTDLTKHILDKASANGRMAPILSMEVSDTTFEIANSINDLKNLSSLPKHNEIADSVTRANHSAINESLVDMIADGRPDIVTKEMVGDEFRNFIEAAYDASRKKANVYYGDAVFEVRSAFQRGVLQEEMPMIKEKAQKIVDTFSPIEPREHNSISRRAKIDANYLTHGINEGTELALEIKELFNEGKPVEGIEKLYDLRSREKHALRKIKLERSIKDRDFTNAFKKFESNFKELESLLPPEAIEAREFADKYYSDTVGGINRHLANMTNKRTSSVTDFVNKTGSTLYNDLVRNPEATKSLCKEISKLSPDNPTLNHASDEFAIKMGGQLLSQCKIIDVGGISDRNLMNQFINLASPKSKKNVGSILLEALSPIVQQAKEFQYNFNLNMSQNANPSKSGVFLRKWLTSLFTYVGAEAYREASIQGKASMLTKLMENPQVPNLIATKSLSLSWLLDNFYTPYKLMKKKDE